MCTLISHGPASNADSQTGRVAGAVWGADDRLRSSLYMTAAVALDAYDDPAVIDCSQRSELSAGC